MEGFVVDLRDLDRGEAKIGGGKCEEEESTWQASVSFGSLGRIVDLPAKGYRMRMFGEGARAITKRPCLLSMSTKANR